MFEVRVQFPGHSGFAGSILHSQREARYCPDFNDFI